MKILKDLLTLPGSGVFTIHTGAAKKARLLKAYYKTDKIEAATLAWKKSLDEISPERPFVIGVPSDNGGGIQRGANWGPLALRQEILSEKKYFFDLGDVRVIPHLLHDKYLNKETIGLCQKALYGKKNSLPVSPLSIAERALEELYKKIPKAKVLGFGGDHSTSYPLFKAWIGSRKKKKESALLHFDAHTDLLDRRMGIDLCFGTWTYHVLDLLSSRDHILQVGIRSSGKDKKFWKKTLGVEQIWAHEFNRMGIQKVYERIKTHYEKLGIKEIYISFDIDALDQKYAAATGTPEKDGLLPSDCAALVRLLAKDFEITGADVMELAPYVLPEGVEVRDQKSSVTVAGDIAKLLLSVLRS